MVQEGEKQPWGWRAGQGGEGTAFAWGPVCGPCRSMGVRGFLLRTVRSIFHLVIQALCGLSARLDLWGEAARSRGEPWGEAGPHEPSEWLLSTLAFCSGAQVLPELVLLNPTQTHRALEAYCEQH